MPQKDKKMISPYFALVPLGGLALSSVNKYTKEAIYDVWSYMAKRGNYNLTVPQSKLFILSDQQSTNDPGEMLVNIWDKYNTWHIQYNEDLRPLTAYMCTPQGFFHISLATCSILKALPSKEPILSDSVKAIFEELNQAMSNGKATPDEVNTLQRVQIICLLNMMLKDISLILNLSGRSNVPEFFKRLFRNIRSLSHSKEGKSFDDIKTTLFDATAEEMKTAKEFLEVYADRVRGRQGYFFSSILPSEEVSLRSIGKMGMVFKSSFQRIVLFISDEAHEDSRFLSESVLKTGQWVKVLSMHYCIILE
jgi:hypothetical protein